MTTEAQSRRANTAIALGLFAATLWLYAPAGSHAFVSYDDTIYIVENPNLRAPLDASAVWRAFASVYESNWIPLTWLSLHADYRIYGPAPSGFHWTNVALHAASSALLFLAFWTLTSARLASALLAAVFAAHPLHVESVAWATERKDTLCGLFWMATLLVYPHYVRASTGRTRVLGYIATSLALALALLSKPMAVTLPFALLLLDFWPLARMRRDGTSGAPQLREFARVVAEKLPWFAMAGAASLVTLSVQESSGAMAHGDLLPLEVRLTNALDAIRWYGVASLVPSGLAVFYPHPLVHPRAALWLGSAVALVLGIGVALQQSRKRPYGLVGLLWFLGTLVPVLGLVQAGLQSRADRYMYLPQIGLALVAIWGARELANTSARRAVAVGVASIVVIGLAVGTRSQLAHWRDTRALFQRALDVTQDNYLALNGLAVEKREAGELAAAEADARAALRIKPAWPDARVTLGDVLADRGQRTEAISEYERVLRRRPDHALAHWHLAVVLIDEERPDQALQHIERATAEMRNTGLDHLEGLRGQALAMRGELDASIAAYRKALALRPAWPEARANLGGVLVRAGRMDAARIELEAALALGVDTPALHFELGQILTSLAENERAIDHYRTGLESLGEWHPAANNLAWLLATRDPVTAQDAQTALAWAEASLDRHGASAAVLDTLAASHAAAGNFARAIEVGEVALAAAEATADPQRDAIADRVAGYRAGRRFIAR